MKVIMIVLVIFAAVPFAMILWIFNNPDKLFWCKECNGYFREDTNCWCDRVTAYEERINELVCIRGDLKN